ncbi:MAG TPA: 2-C-methyl-D-erythritol 4-phosphate cytidylyltransferase [Thermomicrobiaceae bacterium]|nr:2-C-methyl-D-erythritol 4-phosphate cytidylyltransferase [Thermomicrobiaceae bacterium]
MRCGAVVPAAGSSRRMGSIDKVLEPVAGRPSLLWVLAALAASPRIAEVIVVVAQPKEAAVRALLAGERWPWPLVVCRGGATRQESVAAGVARLEPASELVLIHDAARPLVSAALIEDGIACAELTGAAVAAIPVSDTIKRVGPDDQVLATLERRELYAAQTPQVFRRDWLETAYLRRQPGEATDEASLLEQAGFPVQVYPGDPANLKLTRPIDLLVAGYLLERRRAQAAAP